MQPNQGASASNNPSAQTWNYDNSGNWNSTTKTIGNTTTTEARNHSTSDQITSIAGNTATHDAKGNLTDYEINSKTYEVEYDLDNRITKVDVNNTDVEYRYDALGRRVIRKQGSTTSALIWWGNSENAEHKHTATQTVIQNDIMSHPTRLNAVIARAVDGSKFKLEWYHKNYLDHVYAVSDDSGDLIEHYRYTAFGEVTIYDENGNLETSSQIENTIMWNTRRHDTVSGYYLYKYRHYDPALGRWPSRDPIEESGGVNLYSFVGNDAINEWDALGLIEGCKPCFITYELSHAGVDDMQHKGAKGYEVTESKTHRWGYIGCREHCDLLNRIRTNMGMGTGVPPNNGAAIATTSDVFLSSPLDNAGHGRDRSGWFGYLKEVFENGAAIAAKMCKEQCCTKVTIEFKCSLPMAENKKLLVDSGIMTQKELNELCGKKITIECEGGKCSE